MFSLSRYSLTHHLTLVISHFTPLFHSLLFISLYFLLFLEPYYSDLRLLPFLLFRFTLKLKINNLIFCKISIFSISSGSLIFPSLRRLNFFFNFYNLFGICRFSETEDNNFVFHKIFIFFYFPWFVDLSLLRHLAFFFFMYMFEVCRFVENEDNNLDFYKISFFFLFLLVC